MEYRLLEKTELWVEPIELNGVDLEACANHVARVLHLDPNQVIVTDAQEGHLVFDILSPTVDAEYLIGQCQALLTALSTEPGVTIRHDTNIHSDGVLGLITLDSETGNEVLRRSRDIRKKLQATLKRRAIVFPTGDEVVTRKILDTNTPFLMSQLKNAGYSAVASRPLPDQSELIMRSMRRAIEEGFGILIATGGVGAEGKDCTLEALQKLDPNAHIPYVLKFKVGEGRHVKEGVRIGVGGVWQSTIVCLPGPYDEVCRLWPTLNKGLAEGWAKIELANNLASALREKFLAHQGLRRPRLRAYPKGY